MVDQTNKISLREVLDEDFAEASKTALIFVVVLDFFFTVCLER